LEARIEESEKVLEETEHITTDIQREHYLGAAKHKEDVWELNKDLEMLKSGNKRIQRRMNYGLNNPYSY